MKGDTRSSDHSSDEVVPKGPRKYIVYTLRARYNIMYFTIQVPEGSCRYRIFTFSAYVYFIF